jgi:hypothetical protein
VNLAHPTRAVRALAAAALSLAVVACSTGAGATTAPSTAPTAAPSAAATAAPTTAPTSAPTTAPTAAPTAAPSAAASAAPSAAASAAGSVYDTNLKGVCPDTVVVQTNWFPEPDHGYTYELIGPNGTADPSKLIYSGPLKNTGVDLEIRAGGPAIGFQQVSAVMAQDDDILLGYVGTDEAIQNSLSAPTIAVFANYDKNPQTWIWGNPDWDFQSTADIGSADVKVLAFEGSTYLDVFTNAGLLRPEQIDTSYQGGPSRFVAEDGNVVQQAFVTSEPYAYEHEVPEWGKPVQFLLVEEFNVYQSALSVRADKLEGNRACLTALIPMFQQALVDYSGNPGPVNDAIVKYVASLEGGGFVMTAGQAADSSKKQVELELVSNAGNATIGDFDEARVTKLIADIAPVFKAQNKPINENLTAKDIVTNEFLQDGIALP